MLNPLSYRGSTKFSIAEERTGLLPPSNRTRSGPGKTIATGIRKIAGATEPTIARHMECCIINPALSRLMKHLVIGQRQKAPNFSAFHWSPRGTLVSIGQHL